MFLWLKVHMGTGTLVLAAQHKVPVPHVLRLQNSGTFG